LLAIVQFTLQRFGAGFFDPLQSFPPQFLISGYNTYYSLRYQGGIGEFKPNGVIFLEPSLLSLYSVLGLILVLGRLFGRIEGGSLRSNVIWAIVLAGGLAVSASTSGVLVLAAAAIPMILAVRKNRALVVLLLAALLAALGAGAFNTVIAKANEGFTGTTSSALRLTLPYEILGPVWQQHPWFGWGPGAAVKFIEDANILGLQASTLMKLLVEYGLVGAVVLTIIVVYSLWRSGAPLYVSFGIFAAWLLPAEALLNSTLVLMMLFALPHWRPAKPFSREALPSASPVYEPVHPA
jgi:O-antigen ligase